MEGVVMKHHICLISIAIMLVACGSSDNKLPQECKDLFETEELIQIKLDGSPYVTKSMSEIFKKNREESNQRLKKGLSKLDYDKQVRSCTPTAKARKIQLERLSKAKSESEVRQIFPGL